MEIPTLTSFARNDVVVEYHPSLRGGHRPTWQSHTHTLLRCSFVRFSYKKERKNKRDERDPREFSEFKEFRVGMRSLYSLNSLNSLNSLIEVATKSQNHKITKSQGVGVV